MRRLVARPITALACGVLACVVLLPAARAAGDRPAGSPRFTEEREAAALFFVNKHVPEVRPLLEELKRTNEAQYRKEISEIFMVTEMLADLQDQPRRYELELKIWKSETRAAVLVARLSTPSPEVRQQTETSLRELARELVDLDIQVLELRAEQLDRELGEVRDDLSRIQNQIDDQVRQRYERLANWVKKGKK